MNTKPTVLRQHDYISIKLGNNRTLTTSYSGTKASGKVPIHIFDLWDKATRFDAAALNAIGLSKEGANAGLGKVADAFAAVIPTLWPEWDVPPKVPAVGEKVSMNFGKRNGMDEGVVEKVRGTSVTARFSRMGLVVFAADMLGE